MKANRFQAVVATVVLLSLSLGTAVAQAQVVTYEGIGAIRWPGSEFGQRRAVQAGDSFEAESTSVSVSEAWLEYDPATGDSVDGEIHLVYTRNVVEGDAVCRRQVDVTYDLGPGKGPNSNGSGDFLLGTYTAEQMSTLLGVVEGPAEDCEPTPRFPSSWLETWTAIELNSSVDRIGLQGDIIEINDQRLGLIGQVLVEGIGAGNRPPVIHNVDVSNDTPAVGDQISVQVNASDPDGDELNYSWFLNGSLSDGTSRSVNLTFSQAGFLKLTVRVSDPSGTSTEQTVTIRVAPEDNEPPRVRLSLDPESPIEGFPVSFIADATDPDNDELTYSWTLDGVSQGASSAIVVWNEPTAGEHTIAVEVSDGQGGTDRDSLTFMVEGCETPDTGSETEAARSLLRPHIPAVNSRPQQVAVGSCNAEPKIISASIAPKIRMGEATPTVTVEYDNPGSSGNGTLVFEGTGTLTQWTEVGAFPVSLRRNGKGQFQVVSWDRCAAPGTFLYRVTLVTEDGASNKVVYTYECDGGPLQPRLSQPEKDALTEIAENWDIVSKLAGWGGTATCITFGFFTANPLSAAACELVVAAAAGSAGLEESRLLKLARDPADPNYKTISQPQNGPIFTVPENSGFPQSFRSLLDSMFETQANAIAVAEALLHALERGQGANLAGDETWAARQSAAASDLSNKLAELFNQQADLMRSFRAAWENSDLPDLEVSDGDIAEAKEKLASEGLPSGLTNWLKQWGATTADLEAYRQELLNEGLPSNSRSLLDALAGDAIQSALRKGAQSLKAFSGSLNDIPEPPPSGNGFLSISAALDLNGNGRLDDTEIRQAIQLWILGGAVPDTGGQTISDAKIRELIQIWILGESVGASARADAAAISQALRVRSLAWTQPTPLSRTLTVRGRNVSDTEVQVFDLGGRRVLRAHGAGPTLRFQLLDATGRPLANGTYLVAVTARGLDGTRWRSALQKVILLR